VAGAGVVAAGALLRRHDEESPCTTKASTSGSQSNISLG